MVIDQKQRPSLVARLVTLTTQLYQLR